MAQAANAVSIAGVETKCVGDDFPYMMLAITGQWVTEVTLVLCLFGAACIGLAMFAGDGSDSAAPRPVKQNAAARKAGKRKEL